MKRLIFITIFSLFSYITSTQAMLKKKKELNSKYTKAVALKNSPKSLVNICITKIENEEKNTQYNSSILDLLLPDHMQHRLLKCILPPKTSKKQFAQLCQYIQPPLLLHAGLHIAFMPEKILQKKEKAEIVTVLAYDTRITNDQTKKILSFLKCRIFKVISDNNDWWTNDTSNMSFWLAEAMAYLKR